jgi:hypothetical protein
MENVEYNLAETLKWAVQNGILFQIAVEGGVLVVTARNGNIFTRYPIEGNAGDPSAVGGAVWSALYALETGTKFHATHGFMPEPGTPGVRSPKGRGGSRSDNSTNEEPPAPQLHTGLT